MEQQKDNDYTKEKKESHGDHPCSPKHFCLNPWQRNIEIHLKMVCCILFLY